MRVSTNSSFGRPKKSFATKRLGKLSFVILMIIHIIDDHANYLELNIARLVFDSTLKDILEELSFLDSLLDSE